MKILLKVSEVAPRLSMETERLYELIRDGFFPENVVIRFGRQVRIHEQNLIQFLENGRSSEVAEAGGER